MSDDKFRKTPYSEKLRDPRWQKRRLEIMQRDKFSCQFCMADDITLNVHHRWYERGKEPWEACDDALVTLCENCHKRETEARQSTEDRLLRILRKSFFCDALNSIADAFHYTDFDCEPEIFASALDHFLIEPENVKKMVDDYLAWRAEYRDESPPDTKP